MTATQAPPSLAHATVAASADPALTLVVDLDGTLLATDTLFECVASCLRLKPLWTLWMLLQLPFAIARVKRALQKEAVLEIGRMPVNQAVLDYCREARAQGRPVWLSSAADQAVVDRVALVFGPFDRAIGSDGKVNNKGSNKGRKLQELLPEGFEYVGDSAADRKVWARARAASMVGSNPASTRFLRQAGVPLVRQFDKPGGTLKSWRKALRLHQWAKNILLFVAPALAMTLQEPEVFLRCLAGFLCLGVVASGTYLLNDLVDLDADRAHHSKKKRPFASGRLKLWQGFLAAPGLILLGLAGALALSPPFAAGLLAYLVLTLSYSLFLKRKPMVDVVLLAFLYTLRLLIGGAIASVPVTEWLIVFSMFLFISLSFAKRFVEVGRKAAAGETTVQNRGYYVGDASLIEAMGLATAVASPIILVLYIVEPNGPAADYAYAAALWAAPALLSLWLMRIWLLAHRFELDDDPVVFAVKDAQSLTIGAALLAAFVVAAFGVPGVSPPAPLPVASP